MKYTDILEKINQLKANETIVLVQTETKDDSWGDEQEIETKYYLHKLVGNKVIFKNSNDVFNLTSKTDLSAVHTVRIVQKNMKFKKDKVYESKAPTNKSNHIGVEIELCSNLDKDDLSSLIAENDLEEYVELKDDGSIDSEDGFGYTHELCVLANEKEIFKVITKLCSILKNHCKVNRSCGLHVHLDMRNRHVKTAYANLFSMQKLLYSMNPKSRSMGNYSIPKKRFDDVDQDNLGDCNRYEGINRSSYDKHKTIEIRIHSGSLNPKKINNWIKILLRTINIKLKHKKQVKMFDNYLDAKKTLNLKGKLEAYVIERIKTFEEMHRENEMKIVTPFDTEKKLDTVLESETQQNQ